MWKRRREREELEAGMMAAPLEPRRITPMDIQQKEFRLSLRGYNEREVDEFLDALTEELARLQSENVQLRSELETQQRETRAAQAEAEATLRRAREEAARMLEEAELQARAVQPEMVEGSATMTEGAPTVGSFLKKNSMVQAIRPFLGREREFLQSMARLIQEHADSVREEVRQIREVPPGAVPGDETAAQLESVTDADRTALPSETAPEAVGNESTGPNPVVAPPEPELPRRSRKRSSESEPEGSVPATATGEETPSRSDRAHSRDAEDGRRAKDRQAPVPAPTPGPSTGAAASGESTTPGATEGSPTDLFKPKRRVARPPVRRLEEDEARSGSRSIDEPASRHDLTATQPFQPLRFDERSISGRNQPLDTHEGGDEDERSLRELFWGEE